MEESRIEIDMQTHVSSDDADATDPGPDRNSRASDEPATVSLDELVTASRSTSASPASADSDGASRSGTSDGESPGEESPYECFHCDATMATYQPFCPDCGGREFRHRGFSGDATRSLRSTLVTTCARMTARINPLVPR
jgi:hypothetical protein